MTEVNIPTFETPRLILRGVRHLDIPNYEKHFTDYEIISHLSSAVPWPYPANGVQEFLEGHLLETSLTK